MRVVGSLSFRLLLIKFSIKIIQANTYNEHNVLSCSLINNNNNNNNIIHFTETLTSRV